MSRAGSGGESRAGSGGERRAGSGGERIEHGIYTEVRYRQFESGGLARARRAVAVLSWPLVLPLAALARVSDDVFRSLSELLSLVPFLPGVVLRGEFYRFALRRCGRNVVVEFGTVFLYRDTAVGDHVLLGRYNVIHHCDFGSHVLVAEHCAFLSGSRYHRFERADVPIARQGGEKKRIRVGDDCWIGAGAVVMDDVGSGAVVGAGSVVTHPVGEREIVAGNPARRVRLRGEPAGD